jgi:hypothetical protein
MHSEALEILRDALDGDSRPSLQTSSQRDGAFAVVNFR